MKQLRSILFKIIKIIIVVSIPLSIIVLIFIWVNYRKELDLAMSIREQKEVTYLVIFQNTLELRPTGGFIGNFAELTLENGNIKDYYIYNTNAFDYGKPGIEAPEPYKDMLGIQTMQLRDANWSPDFPTTSQQLINLYRLEGGMKDISGVIAINASVLPEILKIIGPVSVNSIDKDKELDAGNILLALQYELNFGFLEKGISRDDRKEPIKDLAFEVEQRIRKASFYKKYQLANMFLEQANQKQIMIWSDNLNIQTNITELGWDGAININSQQDYFKLVDANLGSLKTDYYMKRAIKKEIRECGDKICSTIVITYYNTATNASPLNTDYKSYTRVLFPKDAFINTITGIEKRENEVDYSIMYNKKIAGFEINIPFNSSKDIIIDYSIPQLSTYGLDIQKQSGIEGFEFSLDDKINNKKLNQFIKSDWSLEN